MNVIVREATPDDRLGVRRVLDAAMLEVRDDLRERVESGDVLVATDGTEESGNDAPILGALVLVPRDDGRPSTEDDGAHADGTHVDAAHVDAVTVRRSRRGRGIGSALVRTAAERRGRLTAEFDADVRAFYASLGFEISPSEDGGEGRLRGCYGGDGEWLDGERALL